MDIITRAEWGARPPKYVNDISLSDGIFVHYTVTPTAPEAQIVRNVQAYHMDTKGWSDIAYSFLVGQSGGIYEGRGWGRAGGHTQGYNSTSHAVCWIGNEETPTDAALESINAVIEEHNRRYGRGFVLPHRAVNSTSCPGDKLAAWLDAGRPLVMGETAATPEPPEEEEDDMASAVAWDGRTGKHYRLDGRDATVITEESYAALKAYPWSLPDFGQIQVELLDSCVEADSIGIQNQ